MLRRFRAVSLSILVAAFSFVIVLYIACPKAHAAGESFTGNSSVTGTRDDTIAISNLQVSGSGNATLNINIFVPSGTLTMSHTSGLTFNGPTSGNNLNFSGTRSNINAALATLTFKPSKTADVTVQITIDGLANSVYDPVSHHVYQDVPDAWHNWHNAKTAAEAAAFQGTQGYLATITSADEHNVIKRLGSSGWLGGSDLDNEGEWLWVGGPETGQNFWNGSASGSAPGGAYTDWVSGMPDNYTGSNPGGENCLEMYDGPSYVWNDQNCDAGIVSDYIVEYGDDITNPTLTYKDITIHVTPGRDLNDNSQEDADEPNVSSFLTSDNKWVVVDLGFDCEVLTNDLVAEASLGVQDSAHNYPGGLLDFSGTCDAPGSTTWLSIYYYDQYANDILLRKYNPNTQMYSDLTDVDVEDRTISGHNVAVVTYMISDGNSLDTDGSDSNNQFSDPVGIAVAAISSPDSSGSSNNTQTQEDMLAATGQSADFYVWIGIALITGGSLMLTQTKKRSLSSK